MVSSPVPRRPLISTLFPYTTLFRSAAIRFKIPPRLDIAGTVRSLDDREPFEGVVVQAVPILSGAATNSAPISVLTDKTRSEEHTSELQSHHDLVCRLLLEKKNPSTP